MKNTARFQFRKGCFVTDIAQFGSCRCEVSAILCVSAAKGRQMHSPRGAEHAEDSQRVELGHNQLLKHVARQTELR